MIVTLNDDGGDVSVPPIGFYGRAATATIADDDVNIVVDSKIITLTTTGSIPFRVTNYSGGGQAKTLQVQGYDGTIISPLVTTVNTNAEGYGSVPVEALAEGASNLVLAAPNGNQGQNNQQALPVQVQVINAPVKLYTGQVKTIDVKLIDPATNQQTTDYAINPISQDTTKLTIPDGQVNTPDGNGIYHVTVAGKRVGQVPVNLRTLNLSNSKLAANPSTTVSVLAVNWSISVNHGNNRVLHVNQANGWNTSQITLTATDPTNGSPIDGIAVTASDLFGLLDVSPTAGATGAGFNLPGQLVFDVSVKPNAVAPNLDGIRFDADGWTNGNQVDYSVVA